jgi:PAS domain S-box-containing protein
VLDALVEASVDGVLAFDRELRYTLWNPAMERLSGVPAAVAIGAHALELFPFLVETGEDRAFHAALAGETVTTRRRAFVNRAGRAGFFDGHYRPLRDSTGAVVGGLAIVREVSDAVELDVQRSSLSAAHRDLALGDQRLTVALDAAHLGPWEWDTASDLVTFSAAAAAIFGIPTEPRLTWAAMRELLHPDDRAATHAAVEAAVAGRTDYDTEYRVRLPGGGERWVAAKGRATYRGDGAPERMFGVVQDITARKLAEHALVEESRALDAINRAGQLLAAELDLERLLQALTDVATQISDAQFGSFFYNVVDDRGGSYMLYTLSGVDRAAFSRFPMPRATAVFAPTFAGAGIVRSDDITADPRYGRSEPYRGMPPGHLPVRSYLAVPVASRSGEVLGGLFFGHERTGVFTARHERLLAGIAGQAAIAIDNARLYQKARDAEQEAQGRAVALAEADRRKDDFLAVLAHELRNPLGALSNAIAVLQLAEPGGPEFRRALAVAVRQIDHEKKLIESITRRSSSTTCSISAGCRAARSSSSSSRSISPPSSATRPTISARRSPPPASASSWSCPPSRSPWSATGSASPRSWATSSTTRASSRRAAAVSRSASRSPAARPSCWSPTPVSASSPRSCPASSSRSCRCGAPTAPASAASASGSRS